MPHDNSKSFVFISSVDLIEYDGTHFVVEGTTK
jgi:hypothetical protein